MAPAAASPASIPSDMDWPSGIVASEAVYEFEMETWRAASFGKETAKGGKVTVSGSVAMMLVRTV